MLHNGRDTQVETVLMLKVLESCINKHNSYNHHQNKEYSNGLEMDDFW